MKKFLSLALIGAVVLGASSVVFANVCAFDPVPAASLLFPFVAYDYNGGYDGTTTLFAITNVSSEAQIVHVTLWTDFSVAILDFNILLTGYDVQRMNIRDILKDGNLPITVAAAHTSGREGVADDGPVSSINELHSSDWIGGLMDPPEATNALNAGAVSRCATNAPAYPGQYTTSIPTTVRNLFQQWLQSSQTEDRAYAGTASGCWLGEYTIGSWFETRDDTTPTWMYITADVVETCNKTFPDDDGYWLGEARYDNVLMGDVQWVDDVNRFSEADTAVHLEADMNLDLVATEGNPGFPVSFYARYANLNDDVSDYREPLPTAWAFRYIGALHADFNTYIRAWKGSTFNAEIADLQFTSHDESPEEFLATNCWAYTYYAWDDEENVNTSTSNPWSQPGGEAVVPNLIPLETQEVDIDQFNTVDTFGWMLFVWPNSNVDGLTTITEPDYYQTWMGVKYTAFGNYSTFMTGVVMANYNCFSDQVLPNLGIDYAYVDASTGNYTISPDVVGSAK